MLTPEERAANLWYELNQKDFSTPEAVAAISAEIREALNENVLITRHLQDIKQATSYAAKQGAAEAYRDCYEIAKGEDKHIADLIKRRMQKIDSDDILLSHSLWVRK